MKWVGVALALAVSITLASCASSSRQETLLLHLSPLTLGRTIMQRQQLSVIRDGHTARHLDVMLEANSQVVRLALLSFGQTAARLEWNGHQLKQERASWLPSEISGERVLSELQLVLWPAKAVREALPSHWSLLESENKRTLYFKDDPMILIHYETAQRTKLVHKGSGYQLLIVSQDIEGKPR